MKKQLATAAALAALAFTHAALADGEDPANVSGAGHWDIGAVEHLGDLELEIGQHVGQTHIHHPLGGSIINYNFLAEKSPVTVGSTSLGSVWVTPHSEADADAAGMPFIGFSAEELAAPFIDQLTFTMTGFTYTGSGSGHFFLFEGTDLFWNSTAGPGSYGSFIVNIGQHSHGEFAFSDEGLYQITLTASANNGATIFSAPTSFTFNVVPEPSTYALLALGALALAWHLRRRKA
jgi:surface-anchored protein